MNCKPESSILLDSLVLQLKEILINTKLSDESNTHEFLDWLSVQDIIKISIDIGYSKEDQKSYLVNQPQSAIDTVSVDQSQSLIDTISTVNTISTAQTQMQAPEKTQALAQLSAKLGGDCWKVVGGELVKVTCPFPF